MDSWGPLKALVVASVINGIGEVILCLFVGYGIAGAAWATMASQVVSGFMMVEALKDKGYNGYAVAVPSANELLQIFKLAAPVFIMMMSKGASLYRKPHNRLCQNFNFYMMLNEVYQRQEDC
ncbi:putative multi antimicrobial extrusion protein DinF [Helianthus annuus]|nr:putative multi antimicrobial extrusion protein DinF [Helianthus annuus]